jgi:hypothetical protein
LKYENESENGKVGQENADSIGLNTENDAVHVSKKIKQEEAQCALGAATCAGVRTRLDVSMALNYKTF